MRRTRWRTILCGLLLLVTVKECLGKLLEMHRFEKRVRRGAAAMREEEKATGTPQAVLEEDAPTADTVPETAGQTVTTGQRLAGHTAAAGHEAR